MSSSKDDDTINLGSVAKQTGDLSKAMNIVGQKDTGKGPKVTDPYEKSLNKVTVVARGGDLEPEKSQAATITTPNDVVGGSIFGQSTSTTTAPASTPKKNEPETPRSGPGMGA